MSILYVALGGSIGSLCRFYLSNRMNKKPVGTWIINITGSLFLAFLFHFHTSGNLGEALWLLLGVGFCGAYTTFSTFGYETLQLIFQKKYKWALLYVLSSIIVSLICVSVILYLLS